MRTILVLAMILVAGTAMAGPTASDIVITADGGRALTAGLGSPMKPMLFDIATDGTGWVKFIRFKDGMTGLAAADSGQITLKIVVQLRDYTPPRQIYLPAGADSVYVDLVGATEVIISR
jgi:hypothetical protein